MEPLVSSKENYSAFRIRSPYSPSMENKLAQPLSSGGLSVRYGMKPLRCTKFLRLLSSFLSFTPSKVRQSSMIAIQIFDHKKFRRRDQGKSFLRVYRHTLIIQYLQGFWESTISRPRMPSSLQAILQVRDSATFKLKVSFLCKSPS
jgi:hypothetical protein